MTNQIENLLKKRGHSNPKVGATEVEQFALNINIDPEWQRKFDSAMRECRQAGYLPIRMHDNMDTTTREMVVGVWFRTPHLLKDPPPGERYPDFAEQQQAANVANREIRSILERGGLKIKSGGMATGKNTELQFYVFRESFKDIGQTEAFNRLKGEFIRHLDSLENDMKMFADEMITKGKFRKDYGEDVEALKRDVSRVYQEAKGDAERASSFADLRPVMSKLHKNLVYGVLGKRRKEGVRWTQFYKNMEFYIRHFQDILSKVPQ